MEYSADHSRSKQELFNDIIFWRQRLQDRNNMANNKSYYDKCSLFTGDRDHENDNESLEYISKKYLYYMSILKEKEDAEELLIVNSGIATRICEYCDNKINISTNRCDICGGDKVAPSSCVNVDDISDESCKGDPCASKDRDVSLGTVELGLKSSLISDEGGEVKNSSTNSSISTSIEIRKRLACANIDEGQMKVMRGGINGQHAEYRANVYGKEVMRGKPVGRRKTSRVGMHVDWRCSDCGFTNDSQFQNCVTCFTNKPSTWTCRQCTAFNDMKQERCAVCFSPKMEHQSCCIS